FFCSSSEPCGTRGLGLLVFIGSLGQLIEALVLVLVFTSGFSCKKPEANFKNLFLQIRIMTSQHLQYYHLYWGCLPWHPYLLISLRRKTFRLDAGNFETGRGLSTPVKAERHPLKLHCLPLQSLLLTVNAQPCKE